MLSQTLFAAATLAVVVIAIASSCTDAAFCNQQQNTSGPANNLPIWRGTPTFVRRVPNAELYSVGEGEDTIHLVHLYGTPYEQGFAHGLLMKEEMNTVINGFYNYLYTQIDEIVNNTLHPLHIFLPDWAINKIATIGIDAVLDLQNEWAAPFLASYPAFEEEVRGMADAANVSFGKIVRLYAVPELTRGRCSFMAASPPSTTGNTLQLRSLDWNMDAGLQAEPQITVYHPSPSAGAAGGHAFANVGWTGVSFTLSGMSSKGHGISEIGISYPNVPPQAGYPASPPFGNETSFGLPFVWQERVVLQYDKSLSAAVQRIQAGNRTCRLVLGVADANEKQGALFQYSGSDVNVYYGDSPNQPPHAAWHEKISENLIYLFMDWACPHYNTVGSQQLRKLTSENRLDAEAIVREVVSVVQTGDLHANIYDLTDGVLYTANARATGESGPKSAFNRQFVRVDLNGPYGYNKQFGSN